MKKLYPVMYMFYRLVVSTVVPIFSDLRMAWVRIEEGEVQTFLCVQVVLIESNENSLSEKLSTRDFTAQGWVRESGGICPSFTPIYGCKRVNECQHFT